MVGNWCALLNMEGTLAAVLSTIMNSVAVGPGIRLQGIVDQGTRNRVVTSPEPRYRVTVDPGIRHRVMNPGSRTRYGVVVDLVIMDSGPGTGHRVIMDLGIRHRVTAIDTETMKISIDL